MIIEKKDYIWCVYIHISPSNKYYVGITSQKPNDRWRNGKGYRFNNHFTNAINKYGWDNFQHEIIASNLTEQEAKNFEKLLIAKLQSNNQKFGYNITAGGDGTVGVNHCGENNPFYGRHHSEETKQLMREHRPDMFGKNNPFYGKTFSDDVKQKMSASAKKRFESNKEVYHPIISEERKMQISKEHSKIICQYDLDMNLVKEYDSLISLEKLGYRRASIRDVCLERKESYKGFIWRYKNETDAWNNGYIVGTKSDNIYCLNKDFNINGIYKSYLEASQKSGINRRIISKACKSKEHFSHGYYWLFKDDYEDFVRNNIFIGREVDL